MSSFSEAALIGWDTRLSEGGICDLCGSGEYLMFALGIVFVINGTHTDTLITRVGLSWAVAKPT